jgi:hypothetical protein
LVVPELPPQLSPAPGAPVQLGGMIPLPDPEPLLDALLDADCDPLELDSLPASDPLPEPASMPEPLCELDALPVPLPERELPAELDPGRLPCPASIVTLSEAPLTPRTSRLDRAPQPSAVTQPTAASARLSPVLGRLIAFECKLPPGFSKSALDRTAERVLYARLHFLEVKRAAAGLALLNPARRESNPSGPIVLAPYQQRGLTATTPLRISRIPDVLARLSLAAPRRLFHRRAEPRVDAPMPPAIAVHPGDGDMLADSRQRRRHGCLGRRRD